MDQTPLNIFAECFNTTSVCASDPNEHEFPWERFCFLLRHSFPSEISKEHFHDCAASSWTFSVSWCLKPHFRNSSKQLPKFSCCCNMPPGKLFFSVAWRWDSSAASRCIWILDPPRQGFSLLDSFWLKNRVWMPDHRLPLVLLYTSRELGFLLPNYLLAKTPDPWVPSIIKWREICLSGDDSYKMIFFSPIPETCCV